MKKICALALILCMVASVMALFSFSASAATSGTTGDCTWVLEGTKLTIRGNGRMGEFLKSPWGTTITEAVLEEGVIDIGASAFRGCTNLSRVTLPSSLRVIAELAFDGCTSLKSITIPEGVISIGMGAFSRCDSLLEVNIPKNVATLGMHAFVDCEDLLWISVDEDNSYFSSVDGVLFDKKVTQLITYPSAKRDRVYEIPATVTQIMDTAFVGAIALSRVSIPASVMRIGDSAFFNTGVYYEAQANAVGGGIYVDNCLIRLSDYSVKRFEVQPGTRVIADSAFNGAQNLEALLIPDGVLSMGDASAFYCENLKYVSLPSSLLYIGSSAFYNCGALEQVNYRGGEEDRELLFVDTDNGELLSAEWLYYTCYDDYEHTWSDKKIEISSSCTSEGWSGRVCEVCHVQDGEEIPLDGHNFQLVQTKQATCIEAGVQAWVCLDCGFVDAEILEPTQHVYGPWLVQIEPTCRDVGVKKRICAICGMVMYENIPIAAHDFEQTITKEPTFFKEGRATLSCRACGEIREDAVPQRDPTVAVIVLAALATVLVCATGIVIVSVIVIKKDGRRE